MRNGGEGGWVWGCGTMDVKLSLQTSFPATTESQSKCTSIIVFFCNLWCLLFFQGFCWQTSAPTSTELRRSAELALDLSCVHGLSYTKPETPVGQNGLGLGLAAHFPIYVCTVALATRGFTLRPRDNMSI